MRRREKGDGERAGTSAGGGRGGKGPNEKRKESENRRDVDGIIMAEGIYRSADGRIAAATFGGEMEIIADPEAINEGNRGTHAG